MSKLGDDAISQKIASRRLWRKGMILKLVCGHQRFLGGGGHYREYHDCHDCTPIGPEMGA